MGQCSPSTARRFAVDLINRDFLSRTSFAAFLAWTSTLLTCLAKSPRGHTGLNDSRWRLCGRDAWRRSGEGAVLRPQPCATRVIARSVAAITPVGRAARPQRPQREPLHRLWPGGGHNGRIARSLPALWPRHATPRAAGWRPQRPNSTVVAGSVAAPRRAPPGGGHNGRIARSLPALWPRHAARRPGCGHDGQIARSLWAVWRHAARRPVRGHSGRCQLYGRGTP